MPSRFVKKTVLLCGFVRRDLCAVDCFVNIVAWDCIQVNSIDPLLLCADIWMTDINVPFTDNAVLLPLRSPRGIFRQDMFGIYFQNERH